MLFKDKPLWFKTQIDDVLYNKFVEALTMEDKCYRHNIALMPNEASDIEYVVTYLYTVNKVMNDIDVTGHKFNNIHKVIELLLDFDFTSYFNSILDDEDFINLTSNINSDGISVELSAIYDVLYLLLEIYTNKYITEEVDEIRTDSATDKIMYLFDQYGEYWWCDEIRGHHLKSFIIDNILLDGDILMNVMADIWWRYAEELGDNICLKIGKRTIESEKLLLKYPSEYDGSDIGRCITHAITNELLRIMGRTHIPNNPSLWTLLCDSIDVYYEDEIIKEGNYEVMDRLKGGGFEYDI